MAMIVRTALSQSGYPNGAAKAGGTVQAVVELAGQPRSRTGTAGSGLREVAWQFALEFGKVTGDYGDVETPQDRLLGLAIKQELERCLYATFRRVPASRQSLASVSRHRHMMACLAASDTHSDLEFEWLAFADSLDLDHPAPFDPCGLASPI